MVEMEPLVRATALATPQADAAAKPPEGLRSLTNVPAIHIGVCTRPLSVLLKNSILVGGTALPRIFALPRPLFLAHTRSLRSPGRANALTIATVIAPVALTVKSQFVLRHPNNLGTRSDGASADLFTFRPLGGFGAWDQIAGARYAVPPKPLKPAPVAPVRWLPPAGTKPLTAHSAVLAWRAATTCCGRGMTSSR
jgi:hypothetical protein